jgi:hypothetical protein
MNTERFPKQDFVPRDTVEWFDSMDEAYAVCKERRPWRSIFSHPSWNGGISNAEQRDKLVNEGWQEGAVKIEPLFEAAKLAVIETKGTKYRHDVAGFMPSVPRYCAGNPMNMKRRVKATTSKAPITLVVSVASSSGVSADYMIKRGTSIACLVMYLSIFRAVNLYVTAPMSDEAGGYYIPMVKIGTSPFDLKALAWALCHPGCARAMMYQLLNIPSSSIPWATIKGKNIYNLKGKELDELIKPVLSLKDEDIYFPTMSLEDPKMMADPALWARTYIKDHMNIEL